MNAQALRGWGRKDRLLLLRLGWVGDVCRELAPRCRLSAGWRYASRRSVVGCTQVVG